MRRLAVVLQIDAIYDNFTVVFSVWSVCVYHTRIKRKYRKVEN